MEKILRDRYYLGYVIWGGQEHPGRHQPLIEPELFAQVQEVLARRHRGTRDQTWKHYLKGLLWCARCEGRLVFEPARSQDGRPHFYYRCINRQGGRCDLPRFRLTVIEHAVEAHYATIAVTETERAEVRAALRAALDAQLSTTKALRQRLRTEMTRLESREDAYLELVGDLNWPKEKLTKKMQEINLERDRIRQQLSEADTADYAEAERRITALIDLLSDPRGLYRSLPDDYRQAFNDLCFDKLYIDADGPDTPTVVRTDDSAAREPLKRYCEQLHAGSPEDTKEGRDSRHGPSFGAPCSKVTPTVGLTLAYSNPNPQLDGLLKRLSGTLPARGPETGPMAPGSPTEPPPVAYPPAPSRALGKRLSPTDRDTLIAAFNAGASQQHLATEYGISIRSVKRLVHGNSNRPQATNNRLTPDQRHTIAHTYAAVGTTKAELARSYGVDISTIKRILREHR